MLEQQIQGGEVRHEDKETPSNFKTLTCSEKKDSVIFPLDRYIRPQTYDRTLPKDTSTSKTFAYYFKLNERPCTVSRIDPLDSFVVGTYELVDLDRAKELFPDLTETQLQNKLKAVNNRFGSLYLFSNIRAPLSYLMKDVHRCEAGGVFAVAQSQEQKHIKDNKRLYVAHANGTIGTYDVESTKIVYKGNLSISDNNSTLLTCISCLSADTETQSDDDKPLIVVGDSEGNISMPIWQLEDSISNYKLVVKQICHGPIWQVKFLHFTGALTATLLHSTNHHILVGAEDSRWYIYQYDAKRCELIQLYKNDDFQAGVTSICPCLALCKIFPGGFAIRVFVGSYDETIRDYTIIGRSARENDDRTFSVILNGSLKIPGSGIWCITYHQRPCTGQGPRSALNVATMHANPCKIYLKVADPISTDDLKRVMTDDGREIHMGPSSINYAQVYQLSLESSALVEKPLFYGFMQSFFDDYPVFCVIDFNNRLCTIIEAHSPLLKRQHYTSNEASRERKRLLIQSWLDDQVKPTLDKFAKPEERPALTAQPTIH